MILEFQCKNDNREPKRTACKSREICPSHTYNPHTKAEYWYQSCDHITAIYGMIAAQFTLSQGGV